MLSQARENSGQSIQDDDKRLWERFNELIVELIDINKDVTFETFKITPLTRQYSENFAGYSGLYITMQSYRTALNGLINRLYGTYFYKEKTPFSGPEPFSVTQQQSSSQGQNLSISIAVQLGVELQKAMDKADTAEEKGFVQKIMDGVVAVKTYIDFALLVINAAQQYGITPEKVKALLSGS